MKAERKMLISGFADEIAEDVNTQFEVLNKLGIRYFEPRGIDGKNIADLSDEEAYALKKKMDAWGIKASSIGSPIGKVKLEEDFEEHFQKFQRVVEIAKMLDARYIRIFSFYHCAKAANTPGGPGGMEEVPGEDVPGEWTGEERSRVLERLARMAAWAKSQDVILLHENEKDIYGDTAQRCLDLMKELGGSHFRAVFDPANFVQCGQDTKEAYRALKNDIAYMHIKDAHIKDGRVVPAGKGDGNIEYILRDLEERGFDGFLSLEPHLGGFAGLGALELGDKMKELPPGGEGTFTLACRALEEILDRVHPGGYFADKKGFGESAD